jgi:DNA-binding MarR family transcriptional regulator
MSYVIGRLDRALRRRLSDALEPLGLTIAQYTALSIVRSADGLSNAQLARRTLITPQSMIKVIAGLEDKGLVTRAPDPDHGRVLRTALTARGTEVLERCDALEEQVEEAMLAELADPQRSRLLDDLKACVRGLGAGFGGE